METRIEDHASKGGKARAKALTKQERSEIARRAVEARWERTGQLRNRLLKATHTGELKIGDTTIPCAVLEDGTRLLTQYGYFMAIGRSGKPAAGRGSSVNKLAPFLDLEILKPYVSVELAESATPIVFQLPGGVRAFGYRAETLPKVCEVYLKARDANVLSKTQEKFAVACDIIMRGLAHVGIVSLVDEATGFQAERDRDALAKILEAFVATELRRWVKTFPVDYYRELCRLKSIEYPPPKKNFPQYFGHLTNDLVYDRLAPGVKAELRQKNPTTDRGYRRHRHHQWLTEDIGHPALREHLWAVTSLMKASDTWDHFKILLDRALPVKIDIPMPLFDQVSST